MRRRRAFFFALRLSSLSLAPSRARLRRLRLDRLDPLDSNRPIRPRRSRTVLTAAMQLSVLALLACSAYVAAQGAAGCTQLCLDAKVREAIEGPGAPLAPGCQANDVACCA